jgi:hypothetical protein
MAQFLEVPEHERFHSKQSKGWNRVPKEVARQRQIDAELEAEMSSEPKVVEELPKYEEEVLKAVPKRSKRERMARVKARVIADLEEAFEPTTKEAVRSNRRACGACCVAGRVMRPIAIVGITVGVSGLVALGFVIWIFVRVSARDGSN